MFITTLDPNEFTENANRIKEALLYALEREGLLNKPAKEVAERYVVVIMKPSWLGKMFKTLLGDKEDALSIYVTKAV